MAEPEDDFDMFDPAALEAKEQEIIKVQAISVDKARGLLARRKKAYSNVFKAGKRDTADVELVLIDLMHFCKMFVPTYDIRAGAQAKDLMLIKEGRREVFQRIKDFSCLDEDALFLKYTDATTK